MKGHKLESSMNSVILYLTLCSSLIDIPLASMWAILSGSSTNKESHHGIHMVNGFRDAIATTMSDKSFGFWVI